LWAAERVSQLGGEPDFNPATLAERSHTEYVTVDEADLKRMLTENLVAERIVITSYQEIIRWSRRRRSDRAQVDGEDPRAGGGACRRPQRPARQLAHARP
jgi:DNA-binding ferritin-like protein